MQSNDIQMKLKIYNADKAIKTIIAQAMDSLKTWPKKCPLCPNFKINKHCIQVRI